MAETTVVGESALRRAARLGAALVAGIAVLATVVVLAPGRDPAAEEHERFTRSTSSMESVARTLGEGDELENQSIESLSFERIYREDDLVYFQRGRDVLGEDPYGYVWSPPSGPAHWFVESGDVRHVSGPWYEYHLNNDLSRTE